MKPLFVRNLGGVAYGQPLVATAEPTANGTRDLVIVATDIDTITAFDAKDGSIVWTRSLLPTGDTIVTPGFTGCVNMLHAGVSGTPVIDRSRDAVYVVAESLSGGSNQHIVFRLYSLALGTGKNRSPATTIYGEAQGPTVESVSSPTTNSSAPLWCSPTTACTLDSAVSADFNGSFYHGWMFAYDPDSLKQVGTFMDSPTHDENGNYMGGIWMSGSGATVDAHGNLLFITGNGTFDGQANFGDSAVKIAWISRTSSITLRRIPSKAITPPTRISDPAA